MAHIPEAVRNSSIIPSHREHLLHQGKVRETYRLPDLNNGNHLGTVTSNRISAFDFVFNPEVPYKGAVLTGLTHFWLTSVLRDFPSHLPSNNRKMAHAYASHFNDIPVNRFLVIENLSILPFEMINRAHIGGSVYKTYIKTGKVAGQKVTPNLPKWSALNKPLFTPSTKEENGHDQNITVQKYFAYFRRTGQRDIGRHARNIGQTAYKKAYEFAKERGILILDTKMELGLTSSAQLKIADEILTPDSSRFADFSNWAKAVSEGRDPDFLDKEIFRIWCKGVATPFFDKQCEQIIGIHNLDPLNPEHLAFVDSLEVPIGILHATSERYLEIFFRLTGMHLDQYQQHFLF